jgi:hypothetical protein
MILKDRPLSLMEAAALPGYDESSDSHDGLTRSAEARGDGARGSEVGVLGNVEELHRGARRRQGVDMHRRVLTVALKACSRSE